ncbi:MAG TPA: rhomboid family intramembrane serine protease [Polyangia bacterium]|jgi:membrane associated rhomboid family serine protease
MSDAEWAAEALVRATDSGTRAGDWAVVLAAAGIDYRLARAETGWAIMVSDADEGVARAALDGYDRETAAQPVEGAPPDSRPSRLGIVSALLLAGFYGLTGPRDVAQPTSWFAHGSAVSHEILGGQWWRAITALTLHADLLHLTGNLIACVIFVGAAGRWLGSGVAAALMVLAAAVANVLTAAVHGPGHYSVGASTATFAALGLLAGLQLIRRWRLGPLRRRAWLPIGAGLALFAMLGVGEHADVLAHLFGLGVGVLAGVATALLVRRRIAVLGQIAGALLAVGAVVTAWTLAFTRS